MSNIGRREVVGDQLAFNARETLPDRQLPLSGIRGNNSTNNRLFQEQEQIDGSVNRLKNILGKRAEKMQDDAMTAGKVAFMSGATEAEMRKRGNYHETLGYQSMATVNKANEWFMNEQLALQGTAADMSPDDYRKYLANKNKELFASVGEDPAMQKIYLAAYEDVAPKLASMHQKAHSERNYDRSVQEFGTMLDTGVSSDTTRPRRTASSNLAISDTVIGPAYAGSGEDRDIAIKTMLGEAGGESDNGLAAVAHVLLNRTRDSRWGGSVRDVALAPKQFSTWNAGAGGNNPGRYRPGTAAYERAGRVYDAVVAGKTNDPTGGATHYYSPGGMKKLVADGSQNNLIPRWLQKEAAASGGEIRIGNHIFVGKSNGKSGGARAPGPQLEDTPNDAGEQDASALVPIKSMEESQTERAAMEARAPIHEVGEKSGEAQVEAVAVQTDATPTEVAAVAGVATDETAGRQATSWANIKATAASLKPGDAAKQVSKTMVMQLAMGNTDLYDTANGVAGLRELGADVEDVARVQSAYERFQDKKSKEYNENQISATDALMRGIENGDVDLAQAQGYIRSLVDQELFSPEQATALANRAAEKIRADDGSRLDINMQSEIAANISLMGEQVTADMSDADMLEVQKDFAERAEAIAARYGVGRSVVDRYTQEVFAEAGRKRDKLLQAAQTGADTRMNNERISKEVDQRISEGRGTQNISGSYKNQDGSSQSPDQLYVQRVHEAAMTQAAQEAGANADPDDVAFAADKIKYSKLIKAGIRDDESANEMRSAISGDVLNKDGTVTDIALQAVNKYNTISKMTDGGAYLSSNLDQTTKAFFDMVMTSYAGGGTVDQAIINAATERKRVQDDPTYKVNRDADFSVKLPIAQAAVTKELINDQGFLDKLFGGPVSFDAEAIRKDTAAPIGSFLQRKADSLQLNNRFLSPEAALKGAADILKENAVPIGTTINVAERPEDRLDRKMGLDGQDRNAAQKAFNLYLSQVGPARFGKLWEDQAYSAAIPKWANPFPNSMSTVMPKYEVNTYPGPNGTTSADIMLWNDPNDRGKGLNTGARLKVNDVREIGNVYIQEQNKRGVGADVADSIREFFGRGAGGKFLFGTRTPTWDELKDGNLLVPVK